MFNKIKNNLINFMYGLFLGTIVFLLGVIFYNFERLAFYLTSIVVFIIIITFLTVIGREFRDSIKSK